MEAARSHSQRSHEMKTFPLLTPPKNGSCKSAFADTSILSLFPFPRFDKLPPQSAAEDSAIISVHFSCKTSKPFHGTFKQQLQHSVHHLCH